MILDGFLDTVRDLLDDDSLYRGFVSELAGTNVTFPRGREGALFARLVRAVGVGAAERLCAHFAPERIYVPRNSTEELDRRDAEIRARAAAGESAAEIAKTYVRTVPMTQRQILRIISGNRSPRRAARRMAELA